MSPASLRDALETRQVPIYFVTMAAAGALAWLWNGSTRLAVGIDPLLAFMLFVTFLQVPLIELGRALSNLRFLTALLIANFVAMPLLVALLLPWLPDDPLLRIGVLLVLLTPCIDYVVTFAHLGKADAKSLLASTPLLLGLQMLLLPVYLRVFMGHAAEGLVQWGPFLHAFIWLIAAPLALAAICQAWGARTITGARVVQGLGILPVPATAVVLLVVIAAVAPQLGSALSAVEQVLPIYVIYAVIAPLLGWSVACASRLSSEQGRSVAISAGTRNSLVVLPLGLAIPGALPLIPAVIVTQTVVELISELIYIKALPRLGASVARARSHPTTEKSLQQRAAHRFRRNKAMDRRG